MALIVQLHQNQGIYLGSINDASNINYLYSKQIRYIINCAEECPNVYEYKGEFKYIKFNVDSIQEGFKAHVQQTLQFILENRDANILIHSHFGNNRAVGLLLSILKVLTECSEKEIELMFQIKKADIQLTVEMRNCIEQLKLEKPNGDQYIQEISQQCKTQIQRDSNCSFKCKHCRIDVFHSKHLVHGLKSGCSNYFIERPNHIEEFEQDGKICCQKCKAKIGDFMLIGAKCSCGEWVAPAYVCHKSKIDKKIIDF